MQMQRLRKLTVFFILTFIALSQVSLVSAETSERIIESSSNESSSESSEDPEEPKESVKESDKSDEDAEIVRTSESEELPTSEKEETVTSSYGPAKNKRTLVRPFLVGTADNPSNVHPSWGELGDYHNPNGYESGVNISNVFRPGISSSGLPPQVYENGKVLTITKDQKSQLGAVWSKNKIDLSYDFAFRFDIYLGLKKRKTTSPSSEMGTGDGMTFTFTNDPRIGTADETSVIGSGGKALGAYGVGSAGRNYVRNAISVEYDTFYNDDQDSGLSATDRRYGHIGVVKPAETTPKGHLAVTNSNFWLSFGGTYYDNRLLPGWRSMVVAWHAASRTLMIREENDVDDGIPPISYTFKDEQEMLSTFGGSKEVYFGFTGSTGSLAQTNALMIREMPTAIKSQEATIQNVTQNSSVGTDVTAQRGDKLEIKDSIKIKKNSFGSKNVTIETTLPYGLDFDDKLNLRLNGTEIPETLYEISGQKLKFPNLNLENTSNDLLKEYVIAFNAKVSEGAAIGKSLNTNFHLTNPDALEVDYTSNNVSVTVENPPAANLVLHHKKADSKSVETETISMPIGKKFRLIDYKKATSDYQDYVYTGLEGGDSDETEHEMTSAGAEFTLLYKPKGEFKMTVPKIFNFGSYPIQQKEINATKPKGYEADGSTQTDLSIKDTRYQKSKWTLSLAQSKPIQLEGDGDRKSLADTLYYSDAQINQNASVVESDTFTTDTILNISSSWTDTKGLMMKIPFSKQYKGVYTGELTWTYALAP